MKKKRDLFNRGKKVLLVMKITVLLLIISTMHVSASVKAQSSKFNLDVKQVSIEQMLEQMKAKSEYSFLYRSDLFSNLPKVNVNVTESTVEDILDKYIVPQGFSYTVMDNQVIFFEQAEEELAEAIDAESEAVEVKGTIKDKDGVPLPGATILEDGTLNGVTSDANGGFIIEVTNENAKLRISYIGFKTQVLPVKGVTQLNVVMNESASSLNEVVITGYSKIAKERATGSFFQVDEKTLQEQVTTNVVDRLEGITTGLMFTTTNGDGGNKTKITIRGAGAFYTDTEPLIVVDGFAIEGGIDAINPNDIESINILQDAAAASIWGVQASAGVIVITTKAGKKGQLQVEYSSYFTTESKPDFNALQMASSESLVNYIGNAIETDMDPNYNQGTKNAVELVYADYYDFASGTMSAEGEAKLNKLRNTDVYGQYSDLMLRNAFSQQHNLSVRGGGERNRFYFSTSYNDDKSVEIGDNSSRISALMNNDIDISDKFHLHLGMNIAYRNSQQNAEGLGIIQGISTNFQGLPRFQALLDDSGNRMRIPRGISDDQKSIYENQGYMDWGWNPLDEIENKDITTKSVNLRLQVGLTYNIFDFLSWEIKGQYETSTSETRNQKNLLTYEARDAINRYTIVDQNGSLVYQIPKADILDKDWSETKAYTLRSQFNFDKKFGDDHQLSGVAGMEIREINGNSTFDRYYGYDEQAGLYNTGFNWGLMSKNVEMYNGSTYGAIDNPAYLRTSQNRFISSFMNMAYTYKSKYTVTLSGKIDQTSFFGVDARLRANPLWSVGTAWMISQEDFFKVDFVDMLKFRASYGINGNVQRSATAYTTLYKAQDWGTNEFIYRISSRGNPLLKHEDTYDLNFALDFSLFNYKLSGSLEFYQKRSVDLLANFQVNSTYGYTNQYLNQGEIKNSGIVLNLNGTVMNKGDFKWNAILNLTYNRNTVVKYENTETEAWGLLYYTGYPNPAYAQYIVGKDISSIYAYKWAGLSADGTPQIYDQNGDIQSYTADVTDPAALTVAGQLNPPVYGGLTNTFSYKNFTASVLLTYKLGHVFRRPSHVYMYSPELFHKGEFHQDIDNMWQNPGDEATTDVPRMPVSSDFLGYQSRSNYNDYYTNSDVLIEDASYIRIRQISFDYRMSKDALERIGLPFEGVKFTAQIRNLGMLWTANDYGIDPEAVPFSGGARQMGGANGDQLVVSRPGFKPQPVYTFGINVQF